MLKAKSKIAYFRMPSNGGFLDAEEDVRHLMGDGEEEDVMTSEHGHSHNGHSHSNGRGEEEEEEEGMEGVSHCHSGSEGGDRGREKQSRRAERVLWAVSFLSVVFIAAEFTGGYLASSLAIMTDAGHLLSDLFSFLISIVAIKTARRRPSARHSFGFARAEVLGASVSMLILWALTAVLVYMAIDRIVDGKLDVDADTMLITAGAGVLFNLVMAVTLRCGGQAHAHSHGGSPSIHAHSHEENVNVRAAMRHVIGDFIQSIGVVIAALVIKFTGWQLADPICTFVFSLIVLYTSYDVMCDVLRVLMEASPRGVDPVSVRSDLLQIAGVSALHDLHMWTISGQSTAVSVHLVVEDISVSADVVSAARSVLRRRYSFEACTIQTELHDKSMRGCERCAGGV